MTLNALRSLNLYEVAGYFSSQGRSVDDLVIEHLQLVRDLKKLNAYEETIVRLVAEGYSVKDLALELDVSVRTVNRYIRDLRMTMLESDPRN